MKVAELSRVLRAAEPGAVLVPAPVLDRIIQSIQALPSFLWQVPHRKSLVIDRGLLFRHVDQEELDLTPDQLLPPTVLLLARPAADVLAAAPADKVLLKYWRRLFHASVHRDLDANWAAAGRTDEDLRVRIAAIGAAAFDEIRAVLTQDSYLPPGADDRAVYTEFAAVFLELTYFAAALVPVYFPGLGDPEQAEQLLSRDVDAAALFASTRLEGAPGPLIATDDQADESHDYFHKLVRAANRARRAGNTVRAAILHTRAARVAPAYLTERTNEEAVKDTQILVRRLKAPLHLSDAEEEEWNRLLPTLLDKADQGSQPVEASILFDLEKVCFDHEREIYTLDLVEYFASGGTRPIQRPLPNQRFVRIAMQLRSAARRLTTARLRDTDRKQLGALLDAAVLQAEERLRDRFRPILTDALSDAGLRPGNAPERTAFSKLVEELLDRILEHGFLTFGDLRDAVSRNQMKLPDLTDPQEYIRGDPLLRVNRRLATPLDGVYRRGENYVTMLERFTALNFGTRAGRWLTRNVTLPFGISYAVVKMGEMIAAKVVQWTTPAPPAAEAAAPAAVHHSATELLLGGSEPPTLRPWAYWAIFLALGLVLLALIRSATLREGIARAWGGMVAVLRKLFVEVPTRVVRNRRVTAIVRSWPMQLSLNYLIKPAILVAPLFVFTHLPFGLWSVVLIAAVSVLINSRAGMALESLSFLLVFTPYLLLRHGIVPGLVRWVMQLFKRLLDGVESVLFTVDEWLRFRSGDSPVSLVVRTLLAALWWPVAYVSRFYVVVLVEPFINPVKLPLTILAAKFVYPLLAVLGVDPEATAGALAPWLSTPISYALVFTTLWLSPDAIAFLIWETKENWKLYRANRGTLVRPAAVGPHGETAPTLLRPGFHSGTVPRLYARLREAERLAITAGNWRAVRTCRQHLKEVEQAVRRFVARELAGLVNQSKEWEGKRCAVGGVALSTNRICVSLSHSDYLNRPAELVYAQRHGWLVAGFTDPGWLPDLDLPSRRAVISALASLYKLAGVDLVAEQVQAHLPAGAVGFAVVPAGIVVQMERRDGRELLYDLHDTRGLVRPRSLDGLTLADGPLLDADQVQFSRFKLSWEEWVAAWQRDQDGHGHPPLLDEGEELPLLPLPVCAVRPRLPATAPLSDSGVAKAAAGRNGSPPAEG